MLAEYTMRGRQNDAVTKDIMEAIHCFRNASECVIQKDRRLAHGVRGVATTGDRSPKEVLDSLSIATKLIDKSMRILRIENGRSSGGVSMLLLRNAEDTIELRNETLRDLE